MARLTHLLAALPLAALPALASAQTTPPPSPTVMRGAMPATPGTAAPMAMPAPGTERVSPTPPNPFSDLKLPPQSVGNGAYNGGGVVLEYAPDGSTRLAR